MPALGEICPASENEVIHEELAPRINALYTHRLPTSIPRQTHTTINYSPPLRPLHLPVKGHATADLVLEVQGLIFGQEASWVCQTRGVGFLALVKPNWPHIRSWLGPIIKPCNLLQTEINPSIIFPDLINGTSRIISQEQSALLCFCMCIITHSAQTNNSHAHTHTQWVRERENWHGACRNLCNCCGVIFSSF